MSHVFFRVGGRSDLDIGANRLDGSLPDSIGGMTALMYADDRIQVVSAIPPVVIVLALCAWVLHRRFNASHNLLIGSLPTTIGLLVNLQYVADCCAHGRTRVFYCITARVCGVRIGACR